MRKKFEDLSPEAQELIKLTMKGSNRHFYRIDEEADLGSILKSRPELLAGLREYSEWRDDMCRDEAEETIKPHMGHEAGRIIDKAIELAAKGERPTGDKENK